MFCYFTKADISIKILYFPLEETPERIMQRFISWLLFDFSQGRIRISPRDLRSTKTAVSQEILDVINTDEIQDILKYFEEHVIFPEEAANPTGIYKYCKNYAKEHGKTFSKTKIFKDEFGVEYEKEVFDRYEQDNPNEYRLIIIDTINLIDTERGMTLKQSMDKLSEYCAKYLRNRYHYSPVVIQQQAFDQEGNEAFKVGRVRPSVAGLGDSKYTSRDSNVVLGLFSPFRFALKEYEGYDISKFKDNIRFLEMIVNRDKHNYLYYSDESKRILVEYIESKFGLHFSIVNHGKYYRLRLSQYDFPRFKELIEPYMIESLKYKLRTVS